jgi:hypothetical protein
VQSNFRWWYLLVVVPLVLLRFCLRSSSSSKYDYPSYNSPLYVPPVNTSEIPDLAALLDATSSLRSGQQSFREASATAIDLARQATDRGLTKVSTAAYAVDSALMARDCDEVSSAMTQLEAALKGVDAGESFADTVSSLKIEVRVACSASAKAPAAQTEKVFTEKPIRKN